MRNNPVAAAYNARLGFKVLPNQEEQEYQILELTNEDYFIATEQLRAKAIAVEGNHFTLNLSPTSQTLLDGIGAFRTDPKFEITLNTTHN